MFGRISAMSQPIGKQTAFNREPLDTVALALMGLGSVVQLLIVVAWVMIWISSRWSLGEKIFSVVFVLIGYAIGIGAWRSGAPIYIIPLCGGGAALLTCFALSFRMGMREAAASREAP